MMGMPGELRLSATGIWHHDSVKVTHPEIARYFTQHLRYSPEHAQFVVEVDGKCVPAIVEDAPYQVLELLPAGDVWNLRLSDDTEERFDASTLAVGCDNSFYCYVKNGCYAARFSRSAMQTLLPHIEQDGEKYFLAYGGQRRMIGSYTKEQRWRSK